MNVTDKDIEAVRIALDHFDSDIEGGCEDELFYVHRNLIRKLLIKMNKSKREQGKVL